MKKKLIALSLVFTIGLTLCACGNTTKLSLDNKDATYEIVSEDSRFLKIDSINGWIYVDKETKCQYLWIKRGSGAGMTLLVNSDGTPKLYDAE